MPRLGCVARSPIIAITKWRARCQAASAFRNLDDDLIWRLKRRAARHGRSAEAEHREILRQALSGEAEPSFDDLAAEFRKLTRGRRHTPAEVLLREARDER